MISIKAIKEKAEAQLSEVIQWRRFLHQHPEPAYQETVTANFITNRLDELQISYQSGIAKTGIVGLLKGKNPEKKCIALRADMDALSIIEQNETNYSSLNKGFMHACGHDVHMANLLGTAALLNTFKENWEGTVKLIFQPAEEIIPSGAAAMIAAGVLEHPRPDCIVGLHVTPELDCGTIGYKTGPFMAACDEIYIEVRSKGGHAAQLTNTQNPLFVAAKILTAFEPISNPEKPLILNFGKIIGMGATNIIPEKVNIEGTLRTLHETDRKQIHEYLEQKVQSVAAQSACEAALQILKGYPVLVNDNHLTLKVKQYAENYLGKEKVLEVPIRMGAEDFAYYSHHIPACFFRLGTGLAPSSRYGLHHSRFDIEEQSLLHSTGLCAWISTQCLAEA